MIIPVGAMINAGAIIVGSSIGMLAGNIISEKLRIQILQIFGVCLFGIGISMFLNNKNSLIVVLSCALGVMIGNFLDLDSLAYKFAEKIKKIVKSENVSFVDGFVNSSMLFCVGAMAILGSLEEALEGRREIVQLKSIFDFFTAMLFASASGVGVLLSFVAVLFYQGLLTVLVGFLSSYLTEFIKASIEGVGGIIIIGIGLNLLEIKKLSLINVLPAIAIAVIFSIIYEKFLIV